MARHMDWIYPQLDFQRQVDNERVRLVSQFVHDMHHMQGEIPDSSIAKKAFKSPLWQDLWESLSYTEPYFDGAVRARVQALKGADVARTLFEVRITENRRVYVFDDTMVEVYAERAAYPDPEDYNSHLLRKEANRYLTTEFHLETPSPSRTKEQLQTKLAHYNEYINDTARLWRRGLFEEKFRLGSFAEYRRLRNRYACDVRTLYECHRNRTTLIDSEVIDLTGEENEKQQVDSESVVDLTEEQDEIEEVSSQELDEIEEIESD